LETLNNTRHQYSKLWATTETHEIRLNNAEAQAVYWMKEQRNTKQRFQSEIASLVAANNQLHEFISNNFNGSSNANHD